MASRVTEAATAFNSYVCRVTGFHLIEERQQLTYTSGQQASTSARIET
ncbi:MAG: hypothetical protein VYC23_00975 [Chloroflexota bacterium]|nr:hypothetical protein [Chloroflexota bacterium]